MGSFEGVNPDTEYPPVGSQFVLPYPLLTVLVLYGSGTLPTNRTVLYLTSLDPLLSKPVPCAISLTHLRVWFQGTFPSAAASRNGET